MSNLTMIDHAPRIRARRLELKAELNEAIEQKDLADRAAPLFCAALIALLLLGAGAAGQMWDHWQAAARQSHAMAQCLNGRAIAIDGSILRCEIREYRLIGEVRS